jgi:hypothetical protein
MMFPGPDLPPDPTPAQKRTHQRAWDKWVAEERARVAAQRRFLAKVTRRPRLALEKAMLDRAWALLDAGECEACDALLEFCSEEAADQLLNEYFPDSV